MDFKQLEHDHEPATKPRRTWPGGLRAQLLLVLTAICAALLAALAMTMMQLMRHTMTQTSRDHTRDVAMMTLAEMDAQPASTTFIERQAQLERLKTHSGMALMAWRRGAEEVITTEELPLLDHYRAKLSQHTPPKPLHHEATIHQGKLYTWTIVYEPHTSKPDMVIVALPAQALQGSLTQMRHIIWIVLALNATLIVVLGYGALTYLVVRPLKALGVATQRAASGDLASPIKRQPPNEFGELARSFNVMLLTLKLNRERLEEHLTALELAYKELTLTQDTLIRAEKLASVGQLAAGIAHEVGNPLAALLGYTELLQEDDLDDELRADILVRMPVQIERIQRIIRELLDFSRDDTGQRPEPTTLLDTVQEAVDLVRATPKAKLVEITLDATSLRGIQVFAISSQLIQVLINLIFNAIDAMEHTESPQISLSGRPEDERFALIIRDNGPGISPEIAARLFDPFFTTKEPGKGTGLGLSVSLKLMQRIGADIYVEPSADSSISGATFVISLPLKAADQR